MNSKPSKSARKREYLALQVLGERLIGLTPDQLQGIGLDETLLEAIRAAKSMRTHGALRRQKQLIGKIMRTVDPDPIAAAIHALGETGRIEKEIFRQAEVWRDRLASDDQGALAEFNTLIGNRNDALANAVDSWVSAAGDDSRRIARRIIFREIHNELTSKMQKRTISI